MPPISVRIAVAVTCLAALALAAPAQAAYPGANGKLAFVRDNQIWTMNSDGSGQQQLTNDPTPSTSPQWSPDGSKILYARGDVCTTCTQELRVMNADGTGDAHFAGPGMYGLHYPTWSPDGSGIAEIRPSYLSPGCCHFGAYLETLAPDGSDPIERDVTADPVQFAEPEWSPRGDAFTLTVIDSSSSYRAVDIKPFGGT